MKKAFYDMKLEMKDVINNLKIELLNQMNNLQKDMVEIKIKQMGPRK